MHNASKIISCIKATDCLDGDISSNVQLISKEPLNGVSTGEYRMDIHVSNSAGDAVVLPVTVELYDYDSQNNSIGIVLSDYLVYIKAGQKIDPKSYLKGISRYEKTYSYDADYYSSEYPPYDKDEIVIENNVDVNTAGVYEIKYSIRDNERIRGSVRLVVVVE